MARSDQPFAFGTGRACRPSYDVARCGRWSVVHRSRTRGGAPLRRGRGSPRQPLQSRRCGGRGTATRRWAADGVVSRPEELHLRPLAELCMRLSPHTAPIRQTRHSSLSGLSVAFIASSCFQLSREGNHLIRSLCSGPITAPSSLLRIAVLRIGTLASWLSPLGLLP